MSDKFEPIKATRPLYVGKADVPKVPVLPEEPSMVDAHFSNTSATWVYILDYIEERLVQLDKLNRDKGLDSVATAAIRGQISEVLHLKKLPERIKKGVKKADKTITL